MNHNRSVTRILSFTLLAVLLAGCDRDGTDNGNGQGAVNNGLSGPERVNGRLMGEFTLTGTVASGQPAPYARLCAQDRAEGDLDPLCTVANDQGDYRMLGLFNRRGIVSSDFTDGQGTDHNLFSFFDLTSSTAGTAARANINPTTDVISRVYLFALQDTTGVGCFDTPDCVNQLAAGLNTQILADIQANLTQFLGAAWPPEGYNPFSDRYVADPDRDALHLMHSQLRFIHAENAQGQPELRVAAYGGSLLCTGFELARVSYAELAASPGPDLMGLNEEQVRIADDCRLDQQLPEAPFSIAIMADPARGPATLTSTINVQLFGAPDNTLVTTTLLNPRGQEQAIWTDLTRTVTLSDAGVYRAVVVARSPSDEVSTGTQIEVDGSALIPALVRWGLAGSCFPDTSQVKNLENICLEKRDGSIATPPDTATNCTVLDERPELVYSRGICSASSQYDATALGACTYLDRDSRLFFYRNLDDAHAAETRQQQHDRHQRACTDGDGQWTSLL